MIKVTVQSNPIKRLKLIKRLLDFVNEPEVKRKRFRKDCDVYLKSYQHACGKEKESDEEKKRIFNSAKWMLGNNGLNGPE